jgi:tRNA(fMet)-specific endonuclease VapC
MRYFLDTDTLIALLKDADSRLARRARRENPRDLALSAIVVHELYYGVFKSRNVRRNLALIDALQFAVLAFDTEDARHAGEIRAALAAQGTPIWPL